nr:MAG TPA: hypothetical protein [Caudoviricetes sp.]
MLAGRRRSSNTLDFSRRRASNKSKPYKFRY